MIRRGAVLPAERHADPPNRWIRLVFGGWLAALALLAASAALAQRTSLAGGPHDFRRGHADRPADGSDLCVFCHTPFGERASPNGPQWYRSVQPGLGFQAYATQDDPLAVGMGFDVAGMSVVCLSCHDASQAPTVTALINDHPYGIPYRGTPKMREGADPVPRYVAPPGGGPFRQANFLLSTGDFHRPASGVIDGRVVWWAPLGAASARRTRSDLPLYTRRAGTEFDDLPFVECGTCHDPHSQNRLFLRVGTEGSRLCLVCHQK